VFSKFVAWMYRGDVVLNHDSVTLVELCKLWVLGNELEAPSLQNDIITRCKVKYDETHRTIADSLVNYIYKNTSRDSPLRGMTVQCWAERGSRNQFQSAMGILPREFLEDLCCVWMNRDRKDRMGAADATGKSVQEWYAVPPPSARRTRSRTLSSPTTPDMEPDIFSDINMSPPRSRGRSRRSSSAVNASSEGVSRDVKMEDDRAENVGISEAGDF
jgi:hypothetical protein